MKRLHGLDALRGIAALIVAASHFKMLVLGTGTIPHAGLAVDFFFLLSGYIMARTYEGRMPERFLLVRLKRLWPAFLVGTVLGIAQGPLYLFPLALLFLPVPGANMFPFNPPAWSLFYELAANALHAHVFAKVRDRLLALFLVVLFPLWLRGDFNAGTDFASVPECLVRVCFAYVSGILIWRKWGDIDLPELPLSRLLGRISYPLYVAHYPVMLLPFHWSAILLLVVITTALATWVDGSRNRLWALTNKQRWPFTNRAVRGTEIERGLPAGE